MRDEHTKQKAHDMANGLRQMADVIETYGGTAFPLPWGIYVSVDVAVSEYKLVDDEWKTVYDSEATLLALKKAMRGMGAGKKEKIFDDWHFAVKRDFGGNVEFTVQATRQSVCKKVPTGEIVVHEARVIPERIEEKFDWICEDAMILSAQPDA